MKCRLCGDEISNLFSVENFLTEEEKVRLAKAKIIAPSQVNGVCDSCATDMLLATILN